MVIFYRLLVTVVGEVALMSIVALAIAGVPEAVADPIPYPSPGTVAPGAVLTGSGSDVIAYYYGSDGAAFDEQVGMYVDGVLSPAGFVFPNHATPTGAKVDLGFAPAGAHIVFALQVFDSFEGNYPTAVATSPAGNQYYTGTPSYTLYSVPSDSVGGLFNPGGKNSAYITPFTSSDTNSTFPLPGTYVGFEDLLPDGSAGEDDNYNYVDEEFIFTPELPLAPIPEVTLTANIPKVTLGSGAIGEFTLNLSAPATSDVTVSYKIAGTAINGADYMMLTRKKKFKAGQQSKRIKIIPLGDLGGESLKVVKITLEVGDGYTVDTSSPVKVKILAGK